MPKLDFEVFLKISLPLFIFLGLTQLTTFYYQFKIPILNYIEFSEIITVFLGNIYVYILLLIPLGLFFIEDTKAKGFYYALAVIILGLFVFLSFFNTDFVIMDLEGPILIQTTLFIFANYIYDYGNRKCNSKYKILKFSLFPWLIVGIYTVFTAITTCMVGLNRASEIKSNHVYTGTSVLIDTTTIISNDSIYYIGKTNNYIFFYNEKQQS